MFASLLPLGTFTHAWHAAIAQVSYSNNVCSPRGFTWVPQVLANEVISPLVSQPHALLLVAGGTILAP